MCVDLEIILRDFLVDILRGRANSSECLSWPRFLSPPAKARFSASSFCALTSRTAARLLRLLVKPRSLIQHCSIGWSAIGLPGWPRSRVSPGSIAVVDASFRPRCERQSKDWLLKDHRSRSGLFVIRLSYWRTAWGKNHPSTTRPEASSGHRRCLDRQSAESLLRLRFSLGSPSNTQVLIKGQIDPFSWLSFARVKAPSSF
jgi:hypothetical protein